MTKCLLLGLPVCLALVFVVTTPDFGYQQESHSLRIPSATSLFREIEYLAFGLSTEAQLRHAIDSISQETEEVNCRVRAQTHELFLLQNKNGDRLRSLGVPVFQSVADLENQCIKQVSYPTDTLPKAIRQAPELVALDQTSPRLRWTEFASNYAVIVYAIHESCEDRILKDKQQLSTLLERLKSIRSGGLIPTQGILLQSQVAAISPEHYSQVISHYDIFIDVVTLAINSQSPAKRNVTDELLQELNRRDPLNTLRKKREMLQLFELVRCRETREAFAL